MGHVCQGPSQDHTGLWVLWRVQCGTGLPGNWELAAPVSTSFQMAAGFGQLNPLAKVVEIGPKVVEIHSEVVEIPLEVVEIGSEVVEKLFKVVEKNLISRIFSAKIEVKGLCSCWPLKL